MKYTPRAQVKVGMNHNSLWGYLSRVSILAKKRLICYTRNAVRLRESQLKFAALIAPQMDEVAFNPPELLLAKGDGDTPNMGLPRRAHSQGCEKLLLSLQGSERTNLPSHKFWPRKNL